MEGQLAYRCASTCAMMCHSAVAAGTDCCRHHDRGFLLIVVLCVLQGCCAADLIVNRTQCAQVPPQRHMNKTAHVLLLCICPQGGSCLRAHAGSYQSRTLWSGVFFLESQSPHPSLLDICCLWCSTGVGGYMLSLRFVSDDAWGSRGTCRVIS